MTNVDRDAHPACTSITFVTSYQPKAIYTIQYTHKSTSTLCFISRLIHDRIGQSPNSMRDRTTDLIPILEPDSWRSAIPNSRWSTCNDDRPSWQCRTLRHVGDDPSCQLLKMSKTYCAMENIIELAKPSCMISPLRWVWSSTTNGFGSARGETKTGPIGQKLSKPYC